MLLGDLNEKTWISEKLFQAVKMTQAGLTQFNNFSVRYSNSKSAQPNRCAATINFCFTDIVCAKKL